MRGIKGLVVIIAAMLPWAIRRVLLCRLCGYNIERSAYISRVSMVVPNYLEMGINARICSLTVVKGLQSLIVGDHGFIGPLNWIYGFPIKSMSQHFLLNENRKTRLVIGVHAAITSRHIVDCTDEVIVGDYSIVGGYRTQILTHSIDLKESRQSCTPVRIGRYCFVGTNCVLLGGAKLPDYSVLAAHSMLANAYENRYVIYGGVPARAIKELDKSYKYFSRSDGYIW